MKIGGEGGRLDEEEEVSLTMIMVILILLSSKRREEEVGLVDCIIICSEKKIDVTLTKLKYFFFQ